MADDFCVYVITNAANGAIRKYGEDMFSFEVMHENLEESVAFDLERWYIAEFESRAKQNGYNLTDGGEGASGRAYVASDRARARLSAANTGHVHSEEHKRRIGAAHIGMKRPPGTGEKIAAGQRAAWARNRTPRCVGEACGTAKLTEVNVRAMRALAASGMSHAQIAAIYGITRRYTWTVVNRRTWKHVD